MSETIDLTEYMPHISINCGTEIHVYPTVYFRDLIAGEDVEPLPDNVLRAIIKDWLETLPPPCK